MAEAAGGYRRKAGEKMTAEALMEMGFNKRMASILSRLNEIPDDLQTRQNIQLLGRCVDLYNLKDSLGGILIFLRSPYETNLFMASIPEKYGFTPQEREKYLSDPFNWEYKCDLKEELDEQFQQVFNDPKKRMAVYRKLYLYGGLGDCEVLQASCQIMLEAAGNGKEVEKLISKNPEFFLREGTIQYIHALQKYFKPEQVWKIFKKHALFIADFDDPFHDFECFPFLDYREEVLKRLKEAYPEDVLAPL